MSVGRLSRDRRVLALAAVAAGVLIRRVLHAGRTSSDVSARDELRPSRLNDAERLAARRTSGNPRRTAALAADVALADRYDRYAG